MSEQEERQRVVSIARQYIGTPYHSHGQLKGIGVDCLTLLACVFRDAGLVKNVEIPYYAPDFFKHNGTELYLQGLLKHTQEVTGPPLPGDIVLWKFGRCFSHAAIVVNWPQFVHAHIGRRCMLDSYESSSDLKFIGGNTPDKGKARPMKFFSYWRSDERLVIGRKED